MKLGTTRFITTPDPIGMIAGRWPRAYFRAFDVKVRRLANCRRAAVREVPQMAESSCLTPHRKAAIPGSRPRL